MDGPENTETPELKNDEDFKLEELTNAELMAQEQPENSDEDILEESPDEVTDEGEVEEAEAKEEEKPDNAAFARMRRAEKERDELRAAIAARQEKPAEKEEVDAAPDMYEDPEGYQEWRFRQIQKENEDLRNKLTEHDSVIGEIKAKKQYEAAEKVLGEIESEFRKSRADYDDAVQYMSTMMYQGMKLANPFKSDAEIRQDVKNMGMGIASDAARNGVNAAETLYDIAKNHYGYTPEKIAQMRGDNNKKEEKTVDLKKVSEARKRSPSGLSGGRTTPVTITDSAIAGMTNAQFAALSAEDQRRSME
jgi:hypothetical protein